MKILAIETTNDRGTIAAYDWSPSQNWNLLKSELSTASSESGSCSSTAKVSSFLYSELPSSMRSAQSLVPAISELLEKQNWKISDLDAIAVGIGPGSFTGLRVGVATAKVLAWVLRAKILGINTLSAMASAVPNTGTPHILSCAMDAQRGDAAVQRFYLDGKGNPPLDLDGRFTVMPIKTWLGIDNTISATDNVANNTKSGLTEKNTETKHFIQSELFYQKPYEIMKNGSLPVLESESSILSINFDELNETVPVWFCGPILNKWSEKADDSCRCRFLETEFCQPTATGILLDACRRLAANKCDDPWNLLPIYSRPSAAEERAAARIKATQEKRSV